MPILLALASAVVYGVADYCGGRATRSASAFAVTAVGQASSLVLLGIAVAVLGDPIAPAADWAWGALGGAAGAIGLVSFYDALSRGAMSVVAPLTAVVSVAIPVVAGILLGERPGPLAIVGIVVAGIAVALVTGAGAATGSGAGTDRTAVVFALVGGVGFGLIFLCLERTSADSGLWPLVAARLVSVPLVVGMAVGARRTLRVARPVLAIVLVSGALDMAANVLYLLATREGLLTIVAVVTSLYPVSTVVLALSLDGERVSRSQVVGIGCAAVALAFVSLG